MGYAFLGFKKLKKNKIAQSMVEIAFVFAGVILLLAAIMQVWFWGNKQIVQRQKSYNAGRVTAGTSSDGYTLQWPVHKPEELTEGMVLKGE
ncbi:MAG: hypothetical protein PHC71_02430 [Candidatus Omnitrophica bacterium]|nr:hypothetical protein [Candidatus Omnitrophota bacterium]